MALRLPDCESMRMGAVPQPQQAGDHRLAAGLNTVDRLLSLVDQRLRCYLDEFAGPGFFALEPLARLLLLVDLGLLGLLRPKDSLLLSSALTGT